MIIVTKSSDLINWSIPGSNVTIEDRYIEYPSIRVFTRTLTNVIIDSRLYTVVITYDGGRIIKCISISGSQSCVWFPPHSHLRRPSYRDNLDMGLLEYRNTFDDGLPKHAFQIYNLSSSVETVTGWVKLLQTFTENIPVEALAASVCNSGDYHRAMIDGDIRMIC